MCATTIEDDHAGTAHEMQGFDAWERITKCGNPKGDDNMIRKLRSGKFRLYSRKVDPKTGKAAKTFGTFDTREAAAEHERAVQYFKHQH